MDNGVTRNNYVAMDNGVRFIGSQLLENKIVYDLRVSNLTNELGTFSDAVDQLGVNIAIVGERRRSSLRPLCGTCVINDDIVFNVLGFQSYNGYTAMRSTVYNVHCTFWNTYYDI